MEKREDVLKVLWVLASESVTTERFLRGREVEAEGIVRFAVERGLSAELKDRGSADLGMSVVIWGALWSRGPRERSNESWIESTGVKSPSE